jgi:hypothetical protein
MNVVIRHSKSVTWLELGYSEKQICSIGPTFRKNEKTMAGFKAAMLGVKQTGSQVQTVFSLHSNFENPRVKKKKLKQGQATLSVITHEFHGLDHNSSFSRLVQKLFRS